MHYYRKTDYLAGLSDGFLTELAAIFAGCPVPEADIGLLHLEGALNEHEEDDGAVGNRDARWVFGIKGKWHPGERDSDAFCPWIRDAWTRLHPFSTGRTYINFQTTDESTDRARETYAANHARLVEVKTGGPRMGAPPRSIGRRIRMGKPRICGAFL